jgi:hypothetical protein
MASLVTGLGIILIALQITKTVQEIIANFRR